MRVSEYFGLNKSQAELDFVDVPLEGDLPLFVDPFAISVQPGHWFQTCSNLIYSYFQAVIQSIQNSNFTLAQYLLSFLHEPNDTRLGLSRGRPEGRGIGNKYATALYEKLSRSKAAKTGRLEDLSDCELMIEGIGPDRISDITINVIRKKLLEYTIEQCKYWGVKTESVAAGLIWDESQLRWATVRADIPIYKASRIVLVPKAAVRVRMVINHDEFYKRFMLNFYEAEHLRAETGLVHVLKDGRKKVYKKDLKESHPKTKDNIASFTDSHPDILDQYKEHARASSMPIHDEMIESHQGQPRALILQGLIQSLQSTPPGSEHASTYHDLMLGALEAIFYPELRNPAKEERLNNSRKRIDIVFENGSRAGFFHRLGEKHRIFSPYILVECKNYRNDLKNPELDQMIGRFNDKIGKFGIIVCRNVNDKELLTARCRDVRNANQGCIIVLDDEDIITLLKFREASEYERIDVYLSTKLRTVLFS